MIRSRGRHADAERYHPKDIEDRGDREANGREAKPLMARGENDGRGRKRREGDTTA